jgi:hypothetical protein
VTVLKVLDTSITINMRDGSIYRFREPYIFEYEGVRPPAPPPPKPSLKQRLVKWLLT